MCRFQLFANADFCLSLFADVDVNVDFKSCTDANADADSDYSFLNEFSMLNYFVVQ